MNVSTSPLVDLALVLLNAAIQGAVPVFAALVGTLVYKLFRVHLDNTQQALVATACQDGAGAMYSFLATEGHKIDNVGVRNLALARGVSMAINTLTLAGKMSGVTPEMVQSKVRAEFGKLLAVDPNASVSPGATAPVVPNIVIQAGTDPKAAADTATALLDNAGSKLAAMLGVVLLPAMLLLSACQGAGALVPQTPQQAVFEAVSAYDIALAGAVKYAHLPMCGQSVSPCHDPAIVAQMADYATQAKPLVADALQLSAGSDALAMLKAATDVAALAAKMSSTLPTQKKVN